jgi:hypothetical protein
MMREDTISAMTPEDQLCLLLTRGYLTPEVPQRVLELLASPLQWRLILERAYTHQVYPLLYRSLGAIGFPGVPDAVQAKLKGAFLANAFRNQLLAEELARLLGLLGEAGIPVIPLKGVTLAESLYGDTAYRVCADIDILVPPSDVLRARRVILGSGYSSPFTDKFFVRHQFHTTADCTLFKENELEHCPVEVHWTLLQHSSKDPEAVADLWSQARPQDFFGIRAFNLTPEWQYLHLATHAASHKWQALKWLSDIHELCVSGSDGQNLDWDQIKQKAGRFDLDLVAETTLAACALLYGTPLPTQLCPRPVPTDVRLFPDSLTDSELWNAPLFYPRLLKSPSEKLRWFAQMFFVPRVADHRFLKLPASLSFLYYFLRPLRLTCKWGWLFVRAGFSHLTNNKALRLVRALMRRSKCISCPRES